MTTNIALRFVSLMIVLILAITTLYAGGWAAITLKEFPDFAVAGKPLNVTFIVRQHGVTPLSGLQPAVHAKTATGRSIKGIVTPTSTGGEYSTTLNFPEAGEWTLDIASGFNGNAVTLPALKVIAADAAWPAPFSPMTRGQRLFTAKGCIACHRQVDVNPERVSDPKFDLTGRRFPQDYLKRFLADPSIKPAAMPNLGLTAGEIEALSAFLNK